MRAGASESVQALGSAKRPAPIAWPTHVAAAIPKQDAHLIFAAIKEDKQVAAQWRKAQNGLHIQTQAVKGLTRVYGLRRHIQLHRGRQRQHAALSGPTAHSGPAPREPRGTRVRSLPRACAPRSPQGSRSGRSGGAAVACVLGGTEIQTGTNGRATPGPCFRSGASNRLRQVYRRLGLKWCRAAKRTMDLPLRACACSTCLPASASTSAAEPAGSGSGRRSPSQPANPRTNSPGHTCREEHRFSRGDGERCGPGALTAVLPPA